MESITSPTIISNKRTTFNIQLDGTVYLVHGLVKTRELTDSATQADLNTLNISFNSFVNLDGANWLIHPDDIAKAKALFAQKNLYEKVGFQFRIIHASRHMLWLDGDGILEMKKPQPVTDFTMQHEALEEYEAQLTHEFSEKNQLQHFLIRLSETGEMESLYKQILDSAIAIMYADMGMVQIRVPESDQLLLMCEQGLDSAHAEFLTSIKADSSTVGGQAFVNRERTFIPDIERCDFLKETNALLFLRLSGIKTALTTPLISHAGEIIGVVSTFWTTIAKLSEDKLRVFDLFVQQAAELLHRRTAENTMRINEERMWRLKEAFQATVDAMTLERSLNILTQIVTKETLGTANCAFFTFDDSGKRLTTIQGAGNMPDSFAARIDGSTTGEDVFPGGFRAIMDEPLLTNDVFEDPAWTSIRNLANTYRFASCWIFPMKRFGHTIGIFAMYFRDPREATSSTLSLANIITQAGSVIIASQGEMRRRKEAEVALQQSEQRFRSLVESYAQAVWETNSGGQVVSNSRSWQELTGQSADEAMGHGWLSAIHADDREHAERQWFDAIREQQNLNIEFRLRSGSTGYRWVNMRATPIRDGNGDVLKWTAMSVDIHQKKEAEVVLKNINVRLQEIDKAKTNFFNNVSHEFRTPLTLLLGPLGEVIKSGKSKFLPEDLQKLQVVYRGAMRLQKLVNTLLDFARIEAGKLEAFYQPTDFAKTTSELAANFRSAIEKAGLKFIVKSDVIEAPVYLNREMWEKIVFNLISNAFKFTLNGKIEISIRSKKKNVELRVKDTGLGIAAKNLDRIFERFARVEVPRARTHEGTGIGLALVRELVTVHGGTIKVKSAEGIGSEFTVVIPKGKSHLPKQQIFETMEQLPGKIADEPYIDEMEGWQSIETKLRKRALKNYQRGGVRIIVAEDNADMRDYLTSVLSEDHYQVLPMEDGQKVLAFLSEGGNADLILADVMMPVTDGYELVRQLKSNPKFNEIPVVLLSARSSEQEKIEGLGIGADDYLVKPFSSNELRALISARIHASTMRNRATQQLSVRNLELEHAAEERATELQQLSTSLKSTNHKLASMTEELTNFGFITSHDLREPLRKIKIYASEIAIREEQGLSQRGKDFISKILSAVERQSELIEDIITYSGIASLPESKEEVDLNEIVFQLLEELNGPIQNAEAKIVINPLPSIVCSPLQIKLLLENLLTNAMKFQPKNGTPEISINGQLVAGESIESPLAMKEVAYLKLDVTDNGIGIEEKYLEKIFGIFQRLHAKSEYAGTGIGLAICKRVVENHNGFITTKSVVGKGTTFTCFLPIQPLNSEANSSN